MFMNKVVKQSEEMVGPRKNYIGKSCRLIMIGLTFLGMAINSVTLENENIGLDINNGNSLCLEKSTVNGPFSDLLFHPLEGVDIQKFRGEMLKEEYYQPPLEIKIKTRDSLLDAFRITSDTSDNHWENVVKVPLYDIQNAAPMSVIFSKNEADRADRAVVVCNDKSFLNQIVAISAVLEKTYVPIKADEVIKQIQSHFEKKSLSVISKDQGVLYLNLDKCNNPYLIFIKLSPNSFIDSYLNYTNLALISGKLDFLKLCSKAIFLADGNHDFEITSAIYWIAFQNGVTLERALEIYKENNYEAINRLGAFAIENHLLIEAQSGASGL